MDSPQVVGFTSEQAPIVKRWIEEAVRDRRGRNNPVEVPSGPGARAHVYLCRAPSAGIAALTANLTGTGTGLTDDTLPYADCHLYRVSNAYPGSSGSAGLERSTDTIRVFNLHATAVAAYELFLAECDEWGTWFVGGGRAAAAGGGSSLTVKDLSTPLTYSNISELDEYQDWFVQSNPGAGRVLNQFRPQYLALASFGTSRDPLTLSARAAVYGLEATATDLSVKSITPLDDNQIAFFTNVGTRVITIAQHAGSNNQIYLPNVPTALGTTPFGFQLMPGETVGLWRAPGLYWQVISQQLHAPMANLYMGTLGTPGGVLVSKTGYAGLEDNTSLSGNDVNIPNASFFRTSLAFSSNLTGLQGGIAGRRIHIFLISANTLTIKHDSASSSAANRIYCPGGADYALTQYQGCSLTYSGLSSRWCICDK